MIPLNVSGAFHSRLMQPAADKLADELARTRIEDTKVPVVANVTADYVRTGAEISEALARQIAGSVQWDASVRRMVEDGVERFVEVGPGKVLSGLVKRISDAVEIVNVGDSAALEALG